MMKAQATCLSIRRIRGALPGYEFTKRTRYRLRPGAW